MPTLGRICIYPFKSLDPQPLDEALLLASGALEQDRRFAIVDVHGDVVNGKRTPAVHHLRSRYEPTLRRLTLRIEGSDEEHAFVLGPDADCPPLAAWLSDYFQMPVTVVENDAVGFPDDLASAGPTVVSRATLETVAGWFEGMTLESARRRFRANLELDGAEPFWEDRLVGAGLREVRFAVGEAELLGTNACQRCVVPSRDPAGGETIRQFARRFALCRQQTLPGWAAPDRFDHFYRLAVNTRRAGVAAGTLRVGDAVRLLDTL